MTNLKLYTGKALEEAQPDYDKDGKEIFLEDADGNVLKDEGGNPLKKMIDPYVHNLYEYKDGEKTTVRDKDDLMKALEYARLLNRPLLLRGEPGSGKTRFAQAVAYELYGKEYRKYFFEWHIKSNSKATEGRYTFDHLARLRDIQDESIPMKPSLDKYISYGPLGDAFKSEKPAVLLIDEVDKADIDFPNDLLLELDQKRFVVKELKKDDKLFEVKAKHMPIIIITSNDERDLPNAFLRRCVFHYIKLSEVVRKDLRKLIVAAHLKKWHSSQTDQEFIHKIGQGFNEKFEEYISKIVDRFEQLVKTMENASASKVPDNSELVDWAIVIYHQWLTNKGFDINDLEDLTKVSFPEVLLKNLEDFDKFFKKS